MRAVYGGVRWHLMRHAKREMVLCTDGVSALLWLPATVSVTTKSMGLSVDRPICQQRKRAREDRIRVSAARDDSATCRPSPTGMGKLRPKATEED